MPSLNDLTSAIQMRITNAQAPNGSASALAGASVLVEDDKDIVTQVNKAIAQVGMLILIGEPDWENLSTETNPTSTLNIDLEIAIGEVPILWRVVATRPKAKDTAVILTQLLHNLKITGFKNLKVVNSRKIRDPKRNIFELKIKTALTVPQLP